jgi:hypothetical protein
LLLWLVMVRRLVVTLLYGRRAMYSPKAAMACLVVAPLYLQAMGTQAAPWPCVLVKVSPAAGT